MCNHNHCTNPNWKNLIEKQIASLPFGMNVLGDYMYGEAQWDGSVSALVQCLNCKRELRLTAAFKCSFVLDEVFTFKKVTRCKTKTADLKPVPQGAFIHQHGKFADISVFFPEEDLDSSLFSDALNGMNPNLHRRNNGIIL